MGTMLQSAGLPAGACPEVWNRSHPERILAVHRQYMDAGSEVILTNTFGGSRLKLRRFGLEDRVDDLNRAGVRLARSVARPGVRVAASVGPTGELPEPYGAVSRDELVDAFAEQIGALTDEGADLIWIETMSDLAEAAAALAAARASCRLPVVVTATFDRGIRGYRTMMGTSPEEAAGTLHAAGADYIGANCGVGSEDLVRIIRAMHAAVPSAALVAKPNAGIPGLIAGRTCYPESPAYMAAAIPSLLEAGVRIVGGCCGTTPDHIRQMARMVRNGKDTA
jgi:5-methyltetrahydrofolate--homocysteine methyltransferase